METADLLSAFTEQDQSDVSKPVANNPWSRSAAGNNYDFGSLYAGIAITEISMKDFLSKMVNMMSALLKNDRPKANQKVLDLLKIAIDMYVNEFSIKTDDIHANAKIITAFHGFVQSYIDNSKLKDRL